MILHGLAGTLACRGDAAPGAWLEAAAQRSERELEEHMAHIPSPADAGIQDLYLAEAQRSLGSDAWDQAWAAGGAASLDEAIDYALSIE
jgi:hypothetical protein